MTHPVMEIRMLDGTPLHVVELREPPPETNPPSAYTPPILTGGDVGEDGIVRFVFERKIRLSNMRAYINEENAWTTNVFIPALEDAERHPELVAALLNHIKEDLEWVRHRTQ
jgi:hypothetical protein